MFSYVRLTFYCINVFSSVVCVLKSLCINVVETVAIHRWQFSNRPTRCLHTGCQVVVEMCYWLHDRKNCRNDGGSRTKTGLPVSQWQELQFCAPGGLNCIKRTAQPSISTLWSPHCLILVVSVYSFTASLTYWCTDVCEWYLCLIEISKYLIWERER